MNNSNKRSDYQGNRGFQKTYIQQLFVISLIILSTILMPLQGLSSEMNERVLEDRDVGLLPSNRNKQRNSYSLDEKEVTDPAPVVIGDIEDPDIDQNALQGKSVSEVEHSSAANIMYLRTNDNLFISDNYISEFNETEAASQEQETISTDEIEFLAAHEITSGDQERPIVIMTYDDGGNEENIHHIMEIYEKYNLSTTFFITGEWVQLNLELTQEMIQRGFEIGCHGWDHTEMTHLSDSKVRRQIEEFLQLMDEIAPEYEVRFIRFPYGSRNDRVKQIAAEYGLQSVMWTHSSGGFDENTIENIMSKLEWGSLILSHSTRWYDVYHSEDIILSFLEQGYQIMNVSEGISEADKYQKKVPKFNITPDWIWILKNQGNVMFE